MPAPRVAVTGLGFVTSVGNDRESVESSLRSLRSGIESHEFMPGTDLPVKVAGTLKGFDTSSPQWPAWRWPAGYSFKQDALRGMPPHGLYALCAVEQALADAKIRAEALSNDETGLFCASAGSPRLLRSHLNQVYESRGTRIAPMAIVSTIAGSLNFNLASHFGVRGAVAGFVSACASSTQALGYAIDEIRLGRLKRVLVVAGEDLSFDSIFPFHGMKALSRNPDPATASRPFDRKRDGFVGTGGAVALLLEEEGSAVSRGVSPYAELAGWGQSADGYNMANSDPDGRGLALAMRRALDAAAIGPLQIAYVNAHATSTPAGDLSEAAALRAVLTNVGACPPVSSTKALTGHGLSFSGAMETAFCALAIARGFIPGAANLENPDPACEGLNLPRASVEGPLEFVLKNSSGFGGTNVCLVLRRWHADPSRTDPPPQCR